MYCKCVYRFFLQSYVRVKAFGKCRGNCKGDADLFLWELIKIWCTVTQVSVLRSILYSEGDTDKNSALLDDYSAKRLEFVIRYSALC